MSNRHKELRKTLIDIDGSMTDIATMAGCSTYFVNLISRGKRSEKTELGSTVSNIIDFVIEHKRMPDAAEIFAAA